MVITHRARVRLSWCSVCEQTKGIVELTRPLSSFPLQPLHTTRYFLCDFLKIYIFSNTVLNAKLSPSVLSSSFYLPWCVGGIMSQHWVNLLFKLGHHPLNNPCSTSLPTLSNQDGEVYKETVLLLVNILLFTETSVNDRCTFMWWRRGGRGKNRRWQRSQQLYTCRHTHLILQLV